MKSKDLLTHLSHLETQLNNFSFEELTADEASHLKRSFVAFKIHLEDRILSKKISNPVGPSQDHFSDIMDRPQKKRQDSPESGKENGLLVAKACQKLRVPLDQMIGYTDRLKEGKLTKDQRQYVDALQKSSFTLMEVVTELLEYSRLEAGIEPFEKMDFNVGNVVREVVFLCNTLIIGKDIRVRVNVDLSVPGTLNGDPSKLSQVLMHLLGKVIRSAQKGTIDLTVTSRGQGIQGCFLEFRIKDGAGKAHRAMPYQIGRHEGLGMGIVKQIIHNQKGFLKINSSPETGPIFQFTVPFAIGQEKGRGRVSLAVVKEQERPPRALKVLILEEGPVAQEKKGWGSTTYATNDPHRALSLLERFPFDLVIIDLLKPVADWDSLVRGIRAGQHEAHGKIVVMALTTVIVHGAGKHPGIDGSIVLPKGQEELMDKGTTLKKIIKMTEKMESPNMGPKDLSPEMDLQPILAECMGEIDLLEELIVLYKRNVLEFIGAVKHHMGGPDFEQIQFAAHKIKAGLAMMETYGLHKIVVQMHHNCTTDKDLKYLTFLYNCFLEEYPLVERAIDEALRKLKN